MWGAVSQALRKSAGAWGAVRRHRRTFLGRMTRCCEESLEARGPLGGDCRTFKRLIGIEAAELTGFIIVSNLMWEESERGPGWIPGF